MQKECADTKQALNPNQRGVRLKSNKLREEKYCLLIKLFLPLNTIHAPLCCCQVTSVVSDSVWSQPTRLPRPWDSPGKNTRVGCYFLLQCMKVKSESEVTESGPTLSDPMDCSLPGSSIHGIFQAGVLEWGAIAFSVCEGGLTQKMRREALAQFWLLFLYILFSSPWTCPM